MSAISKKVCMVGAFAVGKSSLVQRFVLATFSDKYITTIGVAIKKKTVPVEGDEVTLMLWDMAGEDEFAFLQTANLRGAAGMIIVIDGTRRSTFEAALRIADRIKTEVPSGPASIIAVINKIDLSAQWEVTDDDLKTLEARGWPVFKGSAKSGEGVQETFDLMARKVTGR